MTLRIQYDILYTKSQPHTLYAVACLTVDSTKISKVSRTSIVSRTSFFASERSCKKGATSYRHMYT